MWLMACPLLENGARERVCQHLEVNRAQETMSEKSIKQVQTERTDQWMRIPDVVGKAN